MKLTTKGLDSLLTELDKRFGPQNIKRVTDEALKEGAKVFVDELKRQFQSFKDTGASIEEITISEPFWEQGKRTIKVHWRGPKQRFRIIHLNEYGTVYNPNPRGKGKIAVALRNSENAYREVIKKRLRRGI